MRYARFIPFAAGATLFFLGVLYFAVPNELSFSDLHIPQSFQHGFPHDHQHPPPHHAENPSVPMPHIPDEPWNPPPNTTISDLWRERAESVKGAYLHAYNGYMKYAKGYDELLPLSKGKVNNFNGWGVTLVDGLDTMYIMGLHEEFQLAMPLLANMTFALDQNNFAPFFETVIRYLGGLLSAYAVSGDPILLARADDLGEMLLPAFDTPSGLPAFAVNTITGKTRQGWLGGTVLWSEAMSCQLEYKYLAHLTGRRKYFDHVERVMNIMRDADIIDGMFPTKWVASTGKPSNNQFSVGAYADSAHEYFLKQWLLTSRSEPKAKDLYLRSARSVLEHLLYLSPTRNLLYVTDVTTAPLSAAQDKTTPSYTFEHLSCFMSGLLVLGASTLSPADGLSAQERELHEWAAQGLGYTCWITYQDFETGLGPDGMAMEHARVSPENPHGGKWLATVEDWKAAGRPGGVPPGLAEAPPKGKGERDYWPQNPRFHLRPETVESFYYLWRTTGDEVWRERGWKIFEAIEKECKNEVGYSSLKNVETSGVGQADEMPSFVMAETFKYLYLLFTDEEIIPLDRWVFNTEAHPLPIFEWAEWEKEQYGIP